MLDIVPDSVYICAKARHSEGTDYHKEHKGYFANVKMKSFFGRDIIEKRSKKKILKLGESKGKNKMNPLKRKVFTRRQDITSFSKSSKKESLDDILS